MLTSQQHLAGVMRPADDADLGDSGERTDPNRGQHRDGIPTASRWDAAAVFVVVVNVYRRPAQVRRLLAVVAALGGVAAVLSIYLVTTRGAMNPGVRNWTVALRPDTSVQLGLFEARNHFALFMNLSV